MNTRVAFFWVGDDISIPKYLVQSLRLVAGTEIEIVQLTDMTTPIVPDVTHISRCALSESIMVARLQAYSYLNSSNKFTYYCDADSIFINPPHIESDTDILLCPRIENFRLNSRYPEYYPEFEGKMIAEVMPFMFGAIAVRGNNNIFSGLLRKCLKLPPRYHRWYGDQIALAKAVGAGNFIYAAMNPHIYLNIMSNIPSEHYLRQLIHEKVQMITFKGPTIEKIGGLSSAFEVLRKIRDVDED
ncbi:MAG: hypothetical protein EBV82_10390 [Chitinophagia bacterium]|nr:hypothetical protein [Chitinophagia bacterium]